MLQNSLRAISDGLNAVRLSPQRVQSSGERPLSPEMQQMFEYQEWLKSTAGDLKSVEDIQAKMGEVEMKSNNKNYNEELDSSMMSIFAATNVIFNIHEEDKANIFYRLAKVLCNWASWSKENEGGSVSKDRYDIAKDMCDHMFTTLHLGGCDKNFDGLVNLEELRDSFFATPVNSRSQSRVGSVTPVTSPEVKESFSKGPSKANPNDISESR